MVVKGSWTPSACFFAIAVAYTIGWTAVSSELTFYTTLYGPEVLLALNAAYFVPSIPIMVMQMLCDERFDRAFGTASATAFRFVLGKRRPKRFSAYGTAMVDKLMLGLGGATLICATFPFHAQKLSVLLLAVALLGIFSGIAFGSSYQLVARFSNSESVALTTGFVGSGPVVLLLEAALRIGAQPKFWQRVVLFEAVAGVIVAGMAAGLFLLSRSWRDLAGHDRVEEAEGDRAELHPSESASRPHARRQHVARQSSFGTSLYAENSQHPQLHSIQVHRHDSASEPLLEGNSDFEAAVTGSLSPRQSLQSQANHWQRMLRIWPAALSLFFSAFTSVLLFPFFTFVPMTLVFGVMQPSALFAARVVADILGRVCPKAQWTQTRAGLLFWSSLRLAATPLFFLYVSGSLPAWVTGRVAVLYVFTFWFSSGYINTCAFMLSPKLVPPALASKAGGLMALVFQTASLAALVLAYGIQRSMRDAPPAAAA